MKIIKVLHLSTHYEDCGVGKYQEQFLEYMEHAHLDAVENKFFGYSPNQTKHMSHDGLSKVIEELTEELKDYDILHIQHEFGFYRHHEFVKFCEVANKQNKALVVTYHTSPAYFIKPVRLGGLGPRSMLHFLRLWRHNRMMFNNHIKPALKANVVIAHNQVTEDVLTKLGVPAAKMQRLRLPVPNIKNYKEVSHEISEALDKKPGDVVISVVGFLHRYKGLLDAVKALKFLPDNYKLAIIGGVHPESDDIAIYNKIMDLVLKLNLENRVYCTGFVKDDDRLNQLIRETDLCAYPYDKVYYAGVSSASMNIAFSNEMPVVAYPVQTFIDIANRSQAILLTNGFSYYELARSIKAADLKVLKERSRKFAKDESYAVITQELLDIYGKLAA
jgi:glycosyltransferase involved in cell wall biosynthesis